MRPAPFIAVALLIALTWAAFWPALGCGFVNYDDPTYVLDNPHVLQGLTVDGFVWAWTHAHAHFWLPLTWLSLQADAQFFHSQAWGFHLTNLVLHTINAVLLFLILHAMTASAWHSALAAALFAIHPLRAESVVWITERKDVLSTMFGLLTAATYVLYARRPAILPYCLTILFYALSLAAKPMLVTLPFLLLLLDYWPLHRIKGLSPVSFAAPPLPTLAPRPASAILLEKLPLLLMAAATGLVAVVTAAGGAGISLKDLSLQSRLANALVSYVRYLGKFLWPTNLVAYYPMPTSWPLWQVAACALLLLGATLLSLRQSRRKPWLAVGWMWFVVALLPVIGLAQNGTQAMADRFTYLPAIGLSLIVAFSIPQSWLRAGARRITLGIAAAAIAACLVGLTRAQSRTWHDSQALFEHALHIDDHNYVAHRNLGATFEMMGRLDDAIAQYRMAIRDRPGYVLPYNNLAVALAHRGQPGDLDEAVNELGLALRFDPTYAEAAFNLHALLAQTHNSRGVGLAKAGHLPEAAAEFRAALAEKPDMPDARANLQRVEEGLTHTSTQPEVPSK